MVKKIIKGILLLIWLGVIYSFSSQNGVSSGGLSEKIMFYIADIVERFVLIDKVTFVNDYVFLLRKGAHMFEFFVLTIFLFSFIKEFPLRNPYILSMLFAYLYASLDEYHQTFVNGRAGQIKDVLIDGIGIIVAIFLCYLFEKWKKCCLEKRR